MEFGRSSRRSARSSTSSASSRSWSASSTPIVDAALRGHPADPVPIYTRFRRVLGRAILLGLELLVAADIIKTVAVTPTLDSVVVLAIIVLIRTFLSWSLELEISGRWPWQKRGAPVDDAASAESI